MIQSPYATRMIQPYNQFLGQQTLRTVQQNYGLQSPLQDKIHISTPRQYQRTISPIRVHKPVKDNLDLPMVIIRPQTERQVPFQVRQFDPPSSRIYEPQQLQRVQEEVLPQTPVLPHPPDFHQPLAPPPSTNDDTYERVKIIVNQLLSEHEATGSELLAVNLISSFILEEAKAKDYRSNSIIDIYQSTSILSKSLRDKVNELMQPRTEFDYKFSFQNVEPMTPPPAQKEEYIPNSLEDDNQVISFSTVMQPQNVPEKAIQEEPAQHDDEGHNLEYLQLIEHARYVAESYINNLEENALQLSLEQYRSQEADESYLHNEEYLAEMRKLDTLTHLSHEDHVQERLDQSELAERFKSEQQKRRTIDEQHSALMNRLQLLSQRMAK